MTFIPEIETIARHEIDERIRRRQQLASPGRHKVRRRASSALRHLADALARPPETTRRLDSVRHQVAIMAGLGSIAASPRSDLSEEPMLGCEPVMLEIETLPRRTA